MQNIKINITGRDEFINHITARADELEKEGVYSPWRMYSLLKKEIDTEGYGISYDDSIKIITDILKL